MRKPQFPHTVLLAVKYDLSYDPRDRKVKPPEWMLDEMAEMSFGNIDYALVEGLLGDHQLLVSFERENDAVLFRLRFNDEIEQ